MSQKISLQKISKSSCPIYLWFLQVLIVLGLISVVIWLSLVPKTPIYTISNVYIPAMKGKNSTFHRNGTIGNSSIIFNLEISNPNRGIGIYHYDINVTLYYSDAIVGGKSVPGFYQGHKKTALREVLVNIADKHFWRGILGGKIDLRVHLKTVVRYKIFRSKIKHRRIDLEAYLAIGSDGRMSGEKNIKLHHTIEQRRNGNQGLTREMQT